MFKVLIIDDEPTIRRGLINIINWKKFQCEICGEACDGIEGFLFLYIGLFFFRLCVGIH